MTSATAYGQRLKSFRAEHSATAEGENCAYGPTLNSKSIKNIVVWALFQSLFNFGWKKEYQTLTMYLLECFCVTRKKSKYNDLILHS